jgi:hypothetical protein
MMRLGIVRPIDMGGIERNVFDREALDKAMSARAAGVQKVSND